MTRIKGHMHIKLADDKIDKTNKIIPIGISVRKNDYKTPWENQKPCKIDWNQSVKRSSTYQTEFHYIKNSLFILTNMLVIGMAVRNFTISWILFNWPRKCFKQRSMCICCSDKVFNKSYKKRSHWRYNVIDLMALFLSIDCCNISCDSCFAIGSTIVFIWLVISFKDARNCSFVVL